MLYDCGNPHNAQILFAVDKVLPLTDIVRGSEEFAQEVVDFIAERINRMLAA
jgi:hypothetical protein